MQIIAVLCNVSEMPTQWLIMADDVTNETVDDIGPDSGPTQK